MADTKLSALAAATAATDADEVYINDGGTSKKITVANFRLSILSAAGMATAIVAASAKTAPVDADSVLIVDSADSNAGKETTMAQVATYVNGKLPAGTVWTSGNDGAGSGLDADTLDGVQYAAIAAAIAALVPAGSISAYGGASIPSGWLYCDGAAVSRATYSALFSAIGTTWGAGDTTTTFNLPNFEGMFLRGVGGTYGSALGAYQADTFASHTHAFTSSSSGSGATAGQALSGSGVFGANAVEATGSTETRPKSYAVHYMIKT